MKEYQVLVAADTRYEIHIRAVCCGKDMSMTVCGGTRHHVGAVALACGCMPDGKPLKYSATVSTLTVLDHKDDVVAAALAKKMADILHANVTVTAGIHIDDANAKELELLQKNCMEACARLLLQMQDAK